MEHLINFLGGYSAHIIYALIFLFLLLCGLGMPIPEDIILLTTGYFVHTGDIKLIPALIITYIAVLIGDTFIYLIGRIWGLSILKKKFFRRIFSEKKIEIARHHFNLYGSKTVFFARFVVGIRSVTFWSAGVVGFKYWQFIIHDGLAALISVPAIVYIGYFFGENLDYIVKKVKRIEIALSVVGGLLLILLIYYSIKKWKKREET